MRELMEIVEPSTANRLADHGVKSINALLNRCRTADEQRAFARDIGLSSRRVQQWIRRADLARITGIGGEYVSLLEAAGISSTIDLATRDAVEVRSLLKQLNDRRRMVKRVPAVSNLQRWIDAAGNLPPLHQEMIA